MMAIAIEPERRAGSKEQTRRQPRPTVSSANVAASAKDSSTVDTSTVRRGYRGANNWVVRVRSRTESATPTH
jgi:hypothetical protein